MSERYMGLMSGTRIRHGIEAALSLTYFSHSASKEA